MAKTALIIGDSHVEPISPFAKALAAKLKAQGYVVTIAGVGSSNAHMWATQNQVCRPGWCVDKTKLPRHPDLLVLSLGTNDAANASAGGPSVEKAVADLKRTIAYFAPKKWFWVGPPWMRDNAQFYYNKAMSQLYAAASRAGVSIFDSRPSTKAAVQAGSGDGVHLGPQGAQLWANATAKAISEMGTLMTIGIALGALGIVGALAYVYRKEIFR
jgi:lysophospholipase L1-like esterase